MNIKQIVLVSSADFKAEKTLALRIIDEQSERTHKEVDLEKKSPADFVSGVPAHLENYCHGDTVFVIDVHCRVAGVAEKLQLQGGVVVYRHLLKLFSEKQEKLKVLFYSPLPKKTLTNRLPENYVLNLLPFVVCNYDGQFASTLTKEIFEYESSSWPSFNNASENLLSGWALLSDADMKKGLINDPNIDLNGKTLLVLDDEYFSWRETYQTIFNSKDLVGTPGNNQVAFRKEWHEKRGAETIGVLAKKVQYVLSDLYIEENHEDTKPYKDISDIESISGFKVFKKIKSECPYIPYMMFTTSNKVWNFQAFRAEGVWAWAVKDNAHNLSREDKMAQYDHFRLCIFHLTQPEWQHAVAIWRELIRFRSKQNLYEYWWYDDCPSALDILHRCMMMLDVVYSQGRSLQTKRVSDFVGRQCSQVLNNLGGICEVLEIQTSGNRRKSVGAYIYHLRSFYSHELYYESAKPLETLFCVDLLLKLLQLTDVEFDNQPKDALVMERDPVVNSNVNYFLQIEDLIRRKSHINYNQQLLSDLKTSFWHIKTNIISDSYKKTKYRCDQVIKLVEKHLGVRQTHGGSRKPSR